MKVLSLFANVGLGEFYFKSAGFNVVVANELLSDRVEFYKKLYPDTNKVIGGDIAKDSIRDQIVDACNEFGPIDLVIATPPCQGMSVANALKKPDDDRNKLVVYALDIFDRIGAKYMLIENVPQMAKTFINHKGSAVNIIDYINQSIPSNYKCICKTLNAKHLGSPQSRRRSISLISPNGSWSHPEENQKIKSLRDAIGHLPSLSNGEHSNLPWHFASNHNPNHVKWMSATPEGETAFNNKIDYPQKDGRKIKGFMTTYKRMFWDQPAPTVTMANGSISSQNNVHPKDPRVLTIRELLCVCGLPENAFDKFANLQTDGTYKYDYSPNFIRKVIGELFLPRMSLSILNNLNETN
jgi:DNA (cytosine-5)-methyltransferase 1